MSDAPLLPERSSAFGLPQDVASSAAASASHSA